MDLVQEASHRDQPHLAAVPEHHLVFIANPCVDGNIHDFHVWVYPTVHSVKFGAVESDSLRVACGLAG